MQCVWAAGGLAQEGGRLARVLAGCYIYVLRTQGAEGSGLVRQPRSPCKPGSGLCSGSCGPSTQAAPPSCLVALPAERAAWAGSGQEGVCMGVRREPASVAGVLKEGVMPGSGDVDGGWVGDSACPTKGMCTCFA